MNQKHLSLPVNKCCLRYALLLLYWRILSADFEILGCVYLGLLITFHWFVYSSVNTFIFRRNAQHEVQNYHSVFLFIFYYLGATALVVSLTVEGS